MSFEGLTLRVATTASLALAPLLIVQGREVRRRMPRLPEAAGPAVGLIGGPEPLMRLLVLGESTVAGVGAATHAEALTGQVAAALAAGLARGVAWRAVGKSGLTATDVRRRLVPTLPTEAVDAVLLALGVNDSLQLRGADQYAADLRALIGELRERIGATPVFLAAAPPMGAFPSLPQPLRAVLGLRAAMLDRTAAELAPQLAAVTHLSLSLPVSPDLFCPDGFHPGPAGYRQWGAMLAGGMAARLRHDQTAATGAG